MSANEKYWRRYASQVRRRVNVGWFFQKSSSPLIITGLLFAIAVVFLRSTRPDWVSPLWLSIAGCGLLIAIAMIGLIRAKDHFIDQSASLTRLDDHLSFDNSLTSADRGVLDWPDQKAVRHSHGGLSWNRTSVLLPITATALIVVAALFIPIPELNATSSALPPNEPAAWQQMEDWLDALDEEELIDEDDLDKAQEKIDELRNQPEDEWYDHSSMEATDSLRDSMGRDIQEISRDLAALERDLSTLESFSGQMSEAARDMIMSEYNEALKNLGLSNMQLSQDLMDQIKNLDLSQLSQQQKNQLTKEQIDKLREQLKSGCK